MENSFPKHTIRRDFQNAIFIIKNGTMEDFKRWFVNYLKCDPEYITDVDIFMCLKEIYADYLNDVSGEVRLLWDYIMPEINILDKKSEVTTFGIKVLWNRLRDVWIRTSLADGEYKYVHGFTEDGIGMIPFTPGDTPETIRKTIDNIIAHTGE